MVTKTHIVYQPAIEYIYSDGEKSIAVSGREQVERACSEIMAVYEECGCMNWNVQCHPVRFCPYCGAKIVFEGKRIVETKEVQ